MARLQRKKKTEKKKKPGDGGESAVSSDGQDAEAVAGEAVSVAPREVQKKRFPAPQKKLSTGTIKIGYLEKGIQFLREAKAELKKVTWPSKKQTIGSTVVVIILVMIISLFLGVVDLALSSLIHVVLQ
ncbi:MULTISPECIES: preprotein translocase subunit SecE [Desulfococcus]|jgi:preprotein translocase subunit SecE|uniref:Protein translocase subunit SecE n=1 Tax=Desulfococcus multivorans DSM 2059 TaxID=1121405 RepID=S7T7B9_DESML|nr:preprotein translocase subunit SecE [Desulfococcus multivorans]AOY59767.1 SecE: predicted preprotein translocase, subunit E [Desulfococcus multivorans]AQX36472.1 preprotein translocase subunit SecE [Desulfococcus multivorans]EPR32481.1 preprotein translocase, SecE subunit [Desulfococcus multivorans DSM 2059]SKA28850.1 preprotein translocase subunit SecE [Desulfococcus multivorans DSM 2059]